MSTRCYDTDLNDAAWAWIAPYLPAARSGGRPRTTDLRAVLNAIFYLLRTGCQCCPALRWSSWTVSRSRPPSAEAPVVSMGFDGHKRVKGRKRHLLVDTLGMVVTRRVEAANVSDRRAGARLLAGLQSGFPSIRTVMADAGYESRKLARELKRRHGWRLHITKRRQRAFKVVGLTWIVERTFAWLARNRRLSKDYELKVQTSEAFIDLAAIRLMLKRLAPR